MSQSEIAEELAATTKTLVDWAARIEMEFMDFKSNITSALQGRFDDIDFLENVATVSKKEERDSSDNTQIIKSIEKLNKSIETLTKKVSVIENGVKPTSAAKSSRKVAQEEYRFEDEQLRSSSKADSLLYSLKSEVENLRNLQEQLIRNMNTQATVYDSSLQRFHAEMSVRQQTPLAPSMQSQSHNYASQEAYAPDTSNISDIKYFLKLLLPKVIKIESECQKMVLHNQKLSHTLLKGKIQGVKYGVSSSRDGEVYEVDSSPGTPPPPNLVPITDRERRAHDDDDDTSEFPRAKRRRLFD